jgi:hypothetical protein
VKGCLTIARLATGIAATSLIAAATIGLRYGGQGLYQSDDVIFPQLIAQDATALMLILPLLAFAVWRSRRGSARALVVWAGTLVYIAYWYHFLLAGIPFGPLFLVHATLVGSSLFGSAALLAQVDVERLAHRFDPRTPARAIGGIMIALGLLFAAVWVGDIVLRLRDREVLDYVARAVYMADLTVMLPVTIVAGILLWRRHMWGFILSGPLLVNAALSMITLLGTGVAVRIAGGEVATPQLGAFFLAAVVMSACATHYLKRIRV